MLHRRRLGCSRGRWRFLRTAAHSAQLPVAVPSDLFDDVAIVADLVRPSSVLYYETISHSYSSVAGRQSTAGGSPSYRIALALNSCNATTGDIISTTERLKHELAMPPLVSCFLRDYQLSNEERAGLELMDMMAIYQEGAYERLCRKVLMLSQ